MPKMMRGSSCFFLCRPFPDRLDRASVSLAKNKILSVMSLFWKEQHFVRYTSVSLGKNIFLDTPVSLLGRTKYGRLPQSDDVTDKNAEV
jgi:hypothetical protein